MEDEAELSYKFQLVPPSPDPKCPRRSLYAQRRNDDEYSYRVEDVLEVRQAADLIDVVFDLRLNARREPLRLLTRPHHVVPSEATISAYEEVDQNLERVLSVSVRATRGGTAL